ncbi:uncharacterized protein LOC103313062 [Tribolium castaneum]|uniref:BRCT domain-containing protein n=1 Tax=Tribolium castaneum TaxID=7070 RepID=D6WLP2_TRICA|nr:PREDICTED: uncharacterized protein LOC103313062 isoform X2 [Tribolium castaneum]EFA04146.2 hypothetical protein TcasGA2_TC014390 [Tribolium castaneum]|eukprot:XP_008193575.1 PREDICTED: uncharacterized protein LOC103313062 isoform X2 [Tribolium castaneum]
MPKSRNPGRGRKKKPLSSRSKSSSCKNRDRKGSPVPQTSRQGAPKTHSPLSSNSETSPFKGYGDNARQTGAKEDLFDKLLKPEFVNLHKSIKTYSNKKKASRANETRLLEFHDCKNRDEIVQWLNDNRNVFDRLTQTQSQDCFSVVSDALTFDMPSVSQLHTPRTKRSRQEVQPRRSPYKLRARSLDIHVKKNGPSGRSKRHSVAGDTPDLEDYHIEEAVTDEEVPAPAAIEIIDFMEDEYLDNLEREMLRERKNHSNSGWERIKDMSKSITPKKPKQLDIVLQSGDRKDSSLEDESFPCYDYELLENYFIENMEDMMLKREDSSVSGHSDGRNTLRNAINVGKLFLTMVRKLTQGGNKEHLGEILPIVAEIKQLFSTSGKNSSTQTPIIQNYSKIIQSEPNTTNIAIQTELETIDTSIQTDNLSCHKNIQTEIKNTEKVETVPQILHRESTTATSTPSDLIFIDQENEDVTKAFEPEKNQDKIISVKEPECDAFDDDLDFNFNTEELIKASKIVEKNDDVRDSGQSCLIVLHASGKESVKGVKRYQAESPLGGEGSRTKRPCAKFLRDDLSVAFSTCADEDRKEGEVIQLEEDSDDEYLPDLLNKSKKLISNPKEPEPTPKTRTQEQIEELENIIYNATKRVCFAGQNEKHVKETPSTSVQHFKPCRVEDDLDYFKPYSSTTPNHNNNTITKTRRNLFNSKTDQDNRFSDSLFVSDRNESVVLNKTITPNNVDEIIKEINWDDDFEGHDREVEEILKREKTKIKILDNVLVKPACSSVKNDDNVSEADDENCYSDVDFVESTPQKKVPSFSKHKDESALDITLPPPLEFQDSEKHENVTTKFEIPVSPRRPLAVLNKVTSTPISQKRDSENFPSLSPIPPTKTKNSKNRILGPIEAAQFSKYSPLTVNKTPSQVIRPNQTPKQRSILNYVRSQASQESQTSSQKKPCIACSRISRDEVNALSALANKGLATYSGGFSPKVTHLVVSVNEQNYLKDHTIKYILAVAAGIWVVNFKWVQECLVKNAIVPEEPYEVLDIHGAAGPRRARLTRLTNPLLKGFKIHPAPPFLTTTQKEVENVIKMLGGVVVPAPECLLDDKTGYVCVIVTEGDTQESDLYKTWLEALKVVTVNLEWLSRSVGQYKVLSLRPFTIYSDDSISIDSLGYPPELVANTSFSFFQPTYTTVPSMEE